MGSCGGSYEFVWLLAYDACDILTWGGVDTSNGSGERLMLGPLHPS